MLQTDKVINSKSCPYQGQSRARPLPTPSQVWARVPVQKDTHLTYNSSKHQTRNQKDERECHARGPGMMRRKTQKGA